MAKVELYTKGWCPYCRRAKALLQHKGVMFTEYDIEQQPALREQMITRAHGGYTVPQIFIDDRHIGGCDDMYALEAQGVLDSLLAGQAGE